MIPFIKISIKIHLDHICPSFTSACFKKNYLYRSHQDYYETAIDIIINRYEIADA
jgi:hypothetical protein